MDKDINKPMREMIAIPLDEYKDLLMCRGRAMELENELLRVHATLDDFIRLQSLVFSKEVRVWKKHR